MDLKEKNTQSIAIASIQDLPMEVLAHIFALSTSILTLSDYEKENGVGLLNLACVCKFWHETIHLFPHSWPHLELVVDIELKNAGPHDVLLPNLCNHLDRWYGRAGDVHRSLTLTMKRAPTRTHILYDYLLGAGWKALFFKLIIFEGSTSFPWLDGLLDHATRSSRSAANGLIPTPCWPNLETLEIVSPFTSYEYNSGHGIELATIAPNLRHLKIYVSELHGRVGDLFRVGDSHPFANLTTFSWEGEVLYPSRSPSFLESLLLEVPNLEVLEYLDAPRPSNLFAEIPVAGVENTLTPLPPHKSLRKMSVHWSGPTASLLRRAPLPRLESLLLSPQGRYTTSSQYHFLRTYMADALVALFRNSLASASELGDDIRLKGLHFHLTHIADDDFYEFCSALREAPVEAITLEDSVWAQSEPEDAFERLQGFRDSLGAEDLFPKLEVFSVNLSQYGGVGWQEVARRGTEGFKLLQCCPKQWWEKVRPVPREDVLPHPGGGNLEEEEESKLYSGEERGDVPDSEGSVEESQEQ
ncbi:hypothetical protein DFP72DRAFT_875344 [Ephemerocybe angulata]|uniref:F-box domain-containing protein n=1 Tax=Ephemerocybe angulata TaxID=980116 RepID=A0A8H6IFN0_9AGAR|nr:hypothetical protein DFP72DRAFT_875344 [Tulosesus angulatus]